MKIAIPLDDTKENICVAFGRAPFFLFYENGISEIMENPAANAQGGAGIQAAQFVVDQSAEVLITMRCGQNSADVFQTADVKIYKADNTSLSENLSAYTHGELAELTHFHAGFHGAQ